LWGGRLSAYLAWRNLGKGEDPRYVAMRARHGEKWPLRSLFQVFILQGALMFLVSLPIQVAQHAQTPPALGLADALGAGLVLLGVLIEGLGDLQLARFKAQPDNRGKVMDQGLWRYTRHPNYFGDFVVWWGLYVIALGTGSAWWTVVGPLVMSILLMRVSGVTLLEKSLKQRPGYAEYVRRTSPFFPRPPRT
jgi:steroid 5-alpha reductase family enzyme